MPERAHARVQAPARCSERTAVVLGSVAPHADWRRLPARTESLRDLREHAVVVVAPDAASWLDARATLRAAPTGSIVLCATGMPATTLAEWVRLGASAVAEEADLTDIVAARLARLRHRVPLLLDDWSPVVVEAGSAGWSALDAVPSLERPFRVRDWSAAMELSRDKLLDLSLAEFRATPSSVLWRYVRCQVRRLRTEGDSLGTIAAKLGYSQASSLLHAWRRHEGCSLPERGRGAPA